ncbi:ABC transporter substrate-binding protein [Oceaniglobus trochenteri]|uniref:ABC transporter substrate-binding protein n=1 Tax=Oceaniglobus trochenteri TaxID=2763260 RepID=UPI001CFFEEC4|nr:ABC transporter substrate-binding protein [Oceaniglobus trochenteri]
MRHLLLSAASALAISVQPTGATEILPEAESLSGLKADLLSRDEIYVYRALETYRQAPFLDGMVASGALPPLADRLPAEPLVFLEGAMSDGTGEYGGVFRHVIGGRPEGWNWVAGQSQGWGGINMAIQECLVRQGPRWQIKAEDQEGPLPNLARSWEWNDVRTVLTMSLLQGVRWSDGDPFDAEDVRFWWEDNVEDPNVSSRMPAGSFGSGTKLRVVDDHTVEFSFDAPQGPTLMESLAFPLGCPGPSHILKDKHPRYNDKADYDSYREAQPAEKLVDVPVLGAWGPAQYRPDELVVLRRNPYYWKVDEAGNQLPYFNEVHFKLASWDDRTTQTISGSADFSNLQNPANYVEVLKQAQRPDAPVTVQFGPRVLSWRLDLNLSRKGDLSPVDAEMRDFFRKLEFRLALSHALNRPAIGNAVARGPFAHPFSGGFAIGSPYFDRDSTVFHPFDQDKARALLDGLGLADTDGDGYRNLPGTGDNLIIDVIYLPDRPEDRKQLDAVVAQLAEVGIRLLVRGTDSTNLNTMRQSGNFTAAFERVPMVIPTRDTCASLPVGPNCPSYHQTDPDQSDRLDFEGELATAYGAFVAAPDAGERAEIAKQIQRLITENVYTIGTVQFPGALLVNKRIRNAHPDTPVFMFEWAEDSVIRERLWTPEDEQIGELLPETITGG